MTQEQINELRKLAEAATPGPWYDRAGVLRGTGGGIKPIATIYNGLNSPYIAAANPAAVLALIQQRDELLTEMRVIEDILNRETNTQDMGYELFRRTNFIRRAIATTERKP